MNLGIKLMKRRSYLLKIKIMKEDQMEILKLKNSINDMKNVIESIGNRADDMEDGISNWKNRNIEIIQLEEGRELRFFKK